MDQQNVEEHQYDYETCARYIAEASSMNTDPLSHALEQSLVVISSLLNDVKELKDKVEKLEGR